MMEKWLEKRGIEPETAMLMGLEQDGEWIKIPYLKDGEQVNAKYRKMSEKAHKQDKDGECVLWNCDVLSDVTLYNQPLIITEGEWDALIAIQCGFVKTVSVPTGAPQSAIEGDSKKYRYLTGLAEMLPTKIPFIILAVDDDKAGRNLFHDLSLRLGKVYCRYVIYPEGCKDLNEVYLKHGRDKVIEIIEQAQVQQIDGVHTLSTLPPLPDRECYHVPFEGFDLNLRLGDFTVITGIPSHGKSTWVNDLTARMAIKHGMKTCFASFEQHPLADHVRNLKRWYKGVYSQANDYQAEEWIEKQFSFVYPTGEQQFKEVLNLEWVMDKMEAAVIKHGANICVLDPWNEVEHSPDKNESMTLYVGRAIKQLKRFAQIMNVHLIVVAHPTKMRKVDGKLEKPSMYDISDSANWANKADIGIVVHKENNVTIVDIQKIRYHDILGKPNHYEMYFNQETLRFKPTMGVDSI